MQLIDERAISRGMVKVDSGEDLVESLQALAEAAGWVDAMVSGAGTLELVELMTASGSSETLENAELISLAGRIHRGPDGKRLVALRATVHGEGAVHTGRITAAMTGGLLLVVDAVSDATAKPARPARTPTDPSPAAPTLGGTNIAKPPAAPPMPGARSASKPLSQSFKTKPVVRPIATHKVDLDDDDDENPIVNVGEFLNHPQLGLCEIVGEDDSGGTKIRVSSGKTRVLRLDALKVLRGEEDDEGRMVYKIVGPRRR